MEIDRFEKGGKKGKSKDKSKGKIVPKENPKVRTMQVREKGTGKHTSKRVAIQNDQCLHCGKYGHLKGTGASRVNQVSDETQSVAGNAAPSTASTSLPSSASAVRLFTMASPVIEELCVRF